MKTGDQPTHDASFDRLAMYRELQRAIPGLDTMYRLAEVLIATHPVTAPRVLVVGAGGGREIEGINSSALHASITAIDPSPDNLALAKRVAGHSENTRFVQSRVEDLPADEAFDVATSLLVMHHLPDDGAKLAYLGAIRDRLAVGGVIIHGDICFEDPDEFEHLASIYEAHARHVGAHPQATQLELRTISSLPVVPPDRIGTLFAQAGFAPPQEIFRSLWYRCWISGHALTVQKGIQT